MTDEPQARDISSDEVLAILVQLNNGEIEIPVAAFIDADINGKYLAIKSRDDYTKMVIVLVDEDESVDD